MILAWVMSLLLLCSSLIVCAERLNALRIVEVHTMEQMQKHFLAAEKAALECEKNLTNLSELEENHCFIQSMGRNHWLITSKEKPAIQIGVVVEEKTSEVTRLNWRQVFD